MWYKLNEDKTIIESIAPTNKKLDDGTVIINYNLDTERLKQDGYVEYNGDKSISQLKVVDGQIVEKSEEDIQADNELAEKNLFEGYYQQNPDLIRCVTEYKTLLDQYSLQYTATTSDISTAVLADDGKNDIEKAQLGFTIQAVWNNVVLNLEYLHINNALYYAWQNMPKLIQYLPKNEGDI